MFLLKIGKAYLAQSPQLYKQMVLCADFDRVFTIGSGAETKTLKLLFKCITCIFSDELTVTAKNVQIWTY